MRDEMIQAFAGKYIVEQLSGVDKKSIPQLASELDMTEEEVLKALDEEMKKSIEKEK